MVHSNNIYLKHYEIMMIYGHKKEDSFIPLIGRLLNLCIEHDNTSNTKLVYREK